MKISQSARTMDIVILPEDIVRPPEDIVIPPEDTVIPPEDIVIPPEDIVIPPEDIVRPPEDVVIPPRGHHETPGGTDGLRRLRAAAAVVTRAPLCALSRSAVGAPPWPRRAVRWAVSTTGGMSVWCRGCQGRQLLGVE